MSRLIALFFHVERPAHWLAEDIECERILSDNREYIAAQKVPQVREERRKER